MDEGEVFAAPQGLGQPRTALAGLTRERARRIARDFVREYRQDLVFPYRIQLLANAGHRQWYLEIDLQHLQQYSPLLHDAMLQKPAEYIGMMELGCGDALRSLTTGSGSGEADEELDGLAAGDAAAVDRGRSRTPPIQVLFVGDLLPTSIRSITAADVNKLAVIPGIIINSSRTRPKATSIALRCRNCKGEKHLIVPAGFGGAAIPRTCAGAGDAESAAAGAGGGGGLDARCPLDPYDIDADKCKYVDQQTLKLQEAPEMVPTGEMPRHLLLVVERNLADRVSPGTRASAIGIVSTVATAGSRGRGGEGGGGGRGLAVKSLYLRVLGIMVQGEGSGRTQSTFTHDEEEEMRRLSREPRIYERLAASVAPSISGDYTTDIKKAILCLLVAGSRKVLPDGVRLRGDINVLMLGDPSTAKSQFLKFVEKVAPVGVYTSGKGSSAAGLTASVIKDAKGEFYLEGGAMVLGDGGVVCIDEFDKMREEDRVAIHEAMEQQTISVAKAGITTILNSRCAVLAAANPVFGRYDDTKSAADNIDLLPTILSRFDLIFIVRDVRNAARDTEIARHVMRVHMSADVGLDEAAGEVSMAVMKRYIAYCRAKCAPRITAEASDFLRAKYVEIRQEARGRDGDAREARLAASEEHSVIPITVRQLEALVRVTEAVAKVALAKDAGVAHAEEALRLFRVSTLSAAASGLSVLEAYMPPEMQQAVQRIERRIVSLVPVGGSTATARVKEQLMRAGFDEQAVNAAIRVMERRGELALVHERKTIRRDR